MEIRALKSETKRGRAARAWGSNPSRDARATWTRGGGRGPRRARVPGGQSLRAELHRACEGAARTRECGAPRRPGGRLVPPFWKLKSLSAAASVIVSLDALGVTSRRMTHSFARTTARAARPLLASLAHSGSPMGRKEENELKLRVSSLRQKVDELEAARASLQRKLDAKGDEIATLNDLNAALRADNVSAQERYAALEATLSAAQRDAALENERSGAFASPARGGGGVVVRARSDSDDDEARDALRRAVQSAEADAERERAVAKRACEQLAALRRDALEMRERSSRATTPSAPRRRPSAARRTPRRAPTATETNPNPTKTPPTPPCSDDSPPSPPRGTRCATSSTPPPRSARCSRRPSTGSARKPRRSRTPRRARSEGPRRRSAG